MADTRNPKAVVSIGKFKPYTHSEHGDGAIREIRYIDGTIERRFFFHGSEREGEGAPDSGYLVDTKVDPDLRKEWDAQKPPAAATGVNPSQAPGGATSQPTGTPTAYDAQGRPTAWDNSRPVTLWTRPDGSVIRADPLTGKDRDEWERGQNEAAGKGRKTDKELEAEAGASGSKPVATHPGYTEHTVRRRNSQTGRDETETYYTDPNGTRVNGLPEKPKDPTVQIVPINGQQWTVRTTPGAAGQPPKVEWINPQTGQVSPPPIKAGTPDVKTTPINGQQYTTVTTVGGDGSVTVEHRDPSGKPIPSLPQAGLVKLPPGAPTFDGTDAQTAWESYQRLFSYVNDRVMRGEMTAEDAKAALAGPHAQVGMLLDKQKSERDEEAGLRRDQLTERSQDMTQAGNRLSFSQNASSTAIKQSTDLIKLAGGGQSTVVPYMVLQAGMGHAMGGFREAPNVTGGGGLMPRVAQTAGTGFAKPANPNTVGTGGNALGFGTPGSITPGGPPQSPAERSAQIMANPVFRPQPSAAYPGGPPAAGAQTVAGNGRGGTHTTIQPRPGAGASANAQATVNAAAVPGTQGPYPSVNGATGDSTGIVPPSQRADGNERPDDVLTIQDASGATMQVPRSYWNTTPGTMQAQWRVINAEPKSAYPTAPPSSPSGPQSRFPGQSGQTMAQQSLGSDPPTDPMTPDTEIYSAPDGTLWRKTPNGWHHITVNGGEDARQDAGPDHPPDGGWTQRPYQPGRPESIEWGVPPQRPGTAGDGVQYAPQRPAPMSSQMLSPQAMTNASRPAGGPRLDPAEYGHSPENPMMPSGREDVMGMPSQILKSGMGYGARTIDDTERELIAEGFSPEEVREAKMRSMRRAGFAA